MKNKIDYEKEWNRLGKDIKKSESLTKRYDVHSEGYDGLRPSEKMLLNQLDKKSKILDVGCGVGRMMRLFPNSIGIDVSEEMLQMNPFKDRVKQMDLTKDLSFEGHRFDAIFIIDVLLHLRDDTINNLLLKCNNLLKEGGHIYIDTIPHYKYDDVLWELKKIYRHMLGRPDPVSAKPILARNMKKKLKKLGFTHETISLTDADYYGSIKYPLVFFKINKKGENNGR